MAICHGSLYCTVYIDIFSEFINLEGHLNRCIGSKVKMILLFGFILPTGEVASGRVCPAACAALQQACFYRSRKAAACENTIFFTPKYHYKHDQDHCTMRKKTKLILTSKVSLGQS